MVGVRVAKVRWNNILFQPTDCPKLPTPLLTCLKYKFAFLLARLLMTTWPSGSGNLACDGHLLGRLIVRCVNGQG